MNIFDKKQTKDSHNKAILLGKNKTINNLTPRQFQIALYILEGNSDKLIAKAIGVSEQYVKNSMQDIFYLTGCKNRTELAVKLWYDIEGKFM